MPEIYRDTFFFIVRVSETKKEEADSASVSSFSICYILMTRYLDVLMFFSSSKTTSFSTLSFSELEAITHIFEELDGNEGILVASKIADRVGITRSVIVNALRKFESAGVIESRSSGMKGTYIKVLNDVVFDELKNIKMSK